MKQIYLDNNATTPLHPEVKKALTQAFDIFGNPSSMHSFGREARKHVEAARESVAKFIGAHSDEIIFVGSGSEANNTVLSLFSCCSTRCGHPLKCSADIVTSKIEHPCILESSKCVADRGVHVRYLNVDKYGKIDVEELTKMLVSGGIGLVSIMTANNEIGTIQDIQALAKMAHENGALFHTDAVQAVGKMPVDVKDLDVDFLTISAHKIYGPKGIGALYVKKGVPFCPLIRGGHQEKGRRAGTENTLGIIGFGKAVEMRAVEMSEEHQRFLELKTILKKGVENTVPDIKFNGHPVDSLASTLNVSFAGSEGEAILLYLDLEGIAVSTGSACASGSLDPSHVILATGVDAEYAHGSIRFSMGRETKKEDIEYVLAKLPAVIQKIRGMSTAYVRGKHGK